MHNKQFLGRYKPKPGLSKAILTAMATKQVRVKSISLTDLRRLTDAGLMVRIAK